MSNETNTQEINLGAKIAENAKWLKEQAAFQEWLKTESERIEARCVHIKYQAEFAILKEKIAFKIGSRQIDLSFNLSEIDFFKDKTSLEIFEVNAGKDFSNWLKKNGLNYKIETTDNGDGTKSEILVVVPDAE